MEIKSARYDYEQHKPRRRFRRFTALILAILLLMSSSGYTAAALTKPIPDIDVSTIPIAGRSATKPILPWPTGSQAAIGSLEDGVLATSNENEQVKPIASMTKIITALTLLEKSPYQVGTDGAVFTISNDDVALFNSYVAKNGAVLPVKQGQTMTQQQALQAVLIASANNIADSLVMRSFGSMEAYTVYANNFVKEKGLKNTTINDASGFSPQTTSTPSDLIVLGQYALQNPVISSIVTQKQADLGVFGVITNTNKLLNDTAVIGIKTGTTDEAGSCLLFAATHQVDTTYSVTLIGVVMGSSSGGVAVQESRNLLIAAKGQFSQVTLAKAGTVVGEAKSEWGQKTALTLKDDLSIYSWNGTELTPKVTVNEISTSLENNQSVGSVTVKTTKNVEVVIKTEGQITEPSTFWRMKSYF